MMESALLFWPVLADGADSFFSASEIVAMVISVLGSSALTLALSAFIFEPMNQRREYVFSEKQTYYNNMMVFAEIVIKPKEAKESAKVSWDIRNCTEERNTENALSCLSMGIPKLKLITKSKKVIEKTELFIKKKDAQAFEELVKALRKDLYRIW